MKKHVFIEGDRIKVINPIFVVRVGYPKTISDYAEKINPENIQRFIKSEIEETSYVKAPINPLLEDKKPESFTYTRDYPAVVWRIQKEMGYWMAKKDGFGGRERTLHTVVLPEYKDKIYTILNKRVVKTGTYYGPCGGYDSYSGEYDYDPGGLENMKTHILLSIHNDSEFYFKHDSHYMLLDPSSMIEATNVEWVKPK